MDYLYIDPRGKSSVGPSAAFISTPQAIIRPSHPAVNYKNPNSVKYG